MNCPKCDGVGRVVDTRPNRRNRETYRRRICQDCGHEYFTMETDVENDEYFRKTWLKYDRYKVRTTGGYKK